MKKVTSVLITALVFVTSFVTAAFSGTKGDDTKIRHLTGNKDKTGKINNLQETDTEQLKVENLEQGKLTNLETVKLTDIEKVKLTDLEKSADADKKGSLETIKVEDLDKADLKLQDLGKMNDLESNR